MTFRLYNIADIQKKCVPNQVRIFLMIQ